jgi:23S rRNA pseudouridine2605 synthase
MRQNGLGTVTLEDARTWIEETGLCLFLPKRQFSSSVAPSFVEAVVGRPEVTPEQKTIEQAEDLLVRLENDGVAIRLNLLGQPGEQPDFVVAAWVLPYVYALRGDRDWRRSPQLTGSRQVSQLAVHVYKQLEGGDQNVAQLKQALGREVSESAVIRAITELWQQLRIIPVIAARGQAAKWQLLRTRFQRAIAEGASTSQVTAISVLASIYLQAAIAASMEDVELFLAPLTARSKIREVIRGLVATRQVHTISLGHAPHFYVAGTLPEFETVSTMYASSSMPASAYFLRSFERDEEAPSPAISLSFAQKPATVHSPAPAPAPTPFVPPEPLDAADHTTRTPVRRAPSNGVAGSEKPQFNRGATNGHERKAAGAGRQVKPAANGRPVRRASEARPSASRPASGRPTSARKPSGTRTASSSRWNGAANGKHNGSHATNGSRPSSSSARQSGSNGAHRDGKTTGPAWTKRTANGKGVKAAVGKAASSRKDARPATRKSRPTLASAGRSAASAKRYFDNRGKQGTKKRG